METLKTSNNQYPSTRYLRRMNYDSSVLTGNRRRGRRKKGIFKKEVYYFLLFVLATGTLLVLTMFSGA